MRLILFFVMMQLSSKAFSQEEAFYIAFEDEELPLALQEIENTYQVIFTYKDSFVAEKRLTLKAKKRTLDQVLIALQEQTELYYTSINARYISVSEAEDFFVNLLDLVTVKSYLTRGIEKNNDGSFVIQPSALEILPGLTEPDVLESIQLLPGVQSPNETATGFFVRGGFTDQNRLIWDGINLYHKGHLFGMISPINPNVVSQIKFINKGTHPKYGERLSSLIDITSRDEIPNQIKAEAGLNGLSADALVEVPLIKEKLSLLASLRSSYTGIVETPTFTQLANKVFESTKISENPNGNNVFFFTDYNLKLNYKPNANNRVFASFINIENKLDYLLQQSDENRSFNDILDIRNTGYSIGWTKKWTGQLTHKVQAFFSNYALNYNFITTEENQTTNFEKRNTLFDSGVSAEVEYAPSQNLTSSLGYQYTLKDVAYAFLSSGELDFVLDTEDSVVQTHSVYSNWAIQLPESVNLSIGFRGTYFEELEDFQIEPRFQVTKAINENLMLKATTEVKNQMINEIDETIFSDLSLENSVWRLSDGDEVPIKRSLQSTLGVIYTTPSFSVDVDTYYRQIDDVSALSLGFLNPENTGFNIGEQSIVGADIFIKKRIQQLNAWVSYSYNHAESTFDNLNESRAFASASSVRHAFSTALSYKQNGFQFSLGWRWQTGRPYTKANASEDNLVFDEGVNTGRLPVYHRLDFSSTYSFNFSNNERLRARIGFSIRNMYNRRSLISREYRGNNNLNDPIETIDRFSLGFTPNLMFRLYW